jgi:hypothetical protein
LEWSLKNIFKAQHASLTPAVEAVVGLQTAFIAKRLVFGSVCCTYWKIFERAKERTRDAWRSSSNEGNSNRKKENLDLEHFANIKLRGYHFENCNGDSQEQGNLYRKSRD